MKDIPPEPRYARLVLRAAWPDLLFSPDLASVLGIGSPAAARRWVARQGIPHLRVGRRLAVRREVLQAALKAMEVRCWPPCPSRPARAPAGYGC